MGSLHANTIACYQCPVLAVTMFIAMKIKGFDIGFFFDGHLEITDWLIFIMLANVSIVSMALKFKALQYDLPGNLSNYSYFASVYQLLYEVLIFD